MTSSQALLQQAQHQLLANQLPQAISTLERATQLFPDNAPAWGLLGHCFRLHGQVEHAEHALRYSLRLSPQFHASRVDLAVLLHAKGDLEEARALLQQVLQHQPNNPQALLTLAGFEEDSNPVLASDYYLACLRLHPNDAALAFRTARALWNADRIDQALSVFSHVIDLQPEHFNARLGVGFCQLRLGLNDKANATFEHALVIQPDNLDALRGKFDALPANLEGMLEQRNLITKLCKLAPSAANFSQMAGVHYNLGDHPACHAALNHALSLDPNYLPAHWQRMQWPLWLSPDTDEDIEAFLHSWHDSLRFYERLAATDIPLDLAQTPTYASPFLRHYLPQADADQVRYGQLLRQLVLPHFPDAPAPPKRQKKRLVIVSAHMKWHTVSRLFVPLLPALTSAFEVHLVSFGSINPHWKSLLESKQIQTHTLNQTPPTIRQYLLDLQADLLLYLEVGMHAVTHWLAAQRLAPIQATMWGHPITTGLPSIDAYLSPEAMETHGAAARYSEKLLLLPGFGHGFEPDTVHQRHQAGQALSKDHIELLCPQSIFKLMPEQDHLFAQILAQLPEARLHLSPHWNPAVGEHLRARMRRACAPLGVDVDRQIQLHPLTEFEDWLAHASRCHLHLDSLHFSGGMSSFDLCAIGLPAITLPSETMRSRQTAAMFQATDLPELIASSPEDYVNKTVALAKDRARCRTLAETLRARSSRLWQREAAAEGLKARLMELSN